MWLLQPVHNGHKPLFPHAVTFLVQKQDQVYAELLVLAIKETEQQNQAAVAEEEGSESSVIDDGGMTYMGWIIDDFPCTVEQVSTFTPACYGGTTAAI